MKRAKCETFLPQLIALDKSAFSKDENINLQKKRGITQRIITNAMKWLWIILGSFKNQGSQFTLRRGPRVIKFILPQSAEFPNKATVLYLEQSIAMKSILTYLCKIIYPSSIYYFLIKRRVTIIPKGNNSSIFLCFIGILYIPYYY